MKIKGLRWYIMGLICLTTALNYMDRQTLALLAHTLERELGITTLQYSHITAAFLTSYTIMYAVSGRLIDYLGSRRGLAIFVSGWSIVDVMHSFARNVWQFMFCRFMLGAAEPANFPAGVKVVSEWFPMRERALAVGIFNSGTAVGAALAAPMVAWVVLHFGWQYSFAVGAVMGVTWVVFWSFIYRLPRQHPCITAEELRLIEDNQPPKAAPKSVSTLRILQMRETWGCILARMLTDPISNFFAFWMPKFLQQERGFDLAAIARYYWIPYAGLAVGNLAGGAIPNYMIRQGWSLDRSRKTMMFIASIMIPVCFILITRVPNPAMAIVCITIAMFFHAAWANMTLPTEVFEKHVVGSVTGFGGAAGSLVSAVTMLVIGRTVTVSSFTPVFVIYSALPLTAFVIVCILVKKLGCVREVPV
ncbi:MAG: MFS transporter [Verrucomicrobiota bacterium]|jgi:ACS family hexuronate transporter-like MFS transporter